MKVKTISRHYKRRTADAMAGALNAEFKQHVGTYSGYEWLRQRGFPEWTEGFEVRRARTRFHYKVTAVSPFTYGTG